MGVRLLTNDSAADALAFLSERPIHTVIMSSFISDHGIENEANRGRFYSYQNEAGSLEGVALIGHATLFETRSEAALAAFARVVRDCGDVRLIIGEQAQIDLFRRHFDPAGQTSQHLRRLLLFEQRWPTPEPQWSREMQESVRGLRLAVAADLDLVVATHARMAMEEFGSQDPIAADPEGFPRRCSTRIERERVWVLIEDGNLVFKADIVSETRDAIYLEGVYVDPKKRGQGYGSRCLSHLGRCLLNRAGVICLFVDEDNERAQSFYRRAGYRFRGFYTTILITGRNGAEQQPPAREIMC